MGRSHTGFVSSQSAVGQKTVYKKKWENFKFDWKVVAAVGKRMEGGLKLMKVKTLHTLCMGEVSRKNGHGFLALVYDLEREKLYPTQRGEHYCDPVRCAVCTL